jgi:hypothetical protein
MYVFRSLNSFTKLPTSQQNYTSAQFSEAKQSQGRSNTYHSSEQSERSVSDDVGCSDSQTETHFGREEQSRTNSNENQFKQHDHDGLNVNKHETRPFIGSNKDQLISSNSFSEYQRGDEESSKKNVIEKLYVGAQKERGGISPEV